jgi:transcriptional regulator with XRE-family HTH domain
MQAWHSPPISGIITPSKTMMVTIMLDNAAKTEGFAQRLHSLRKARDLSQSQLGERAGLHYTHIGRFERGTSRPGGDTLKRLADSLDTTSDFLLEGASDDAAAARVTDRELLRQFQAVEHLPDTDKHIVKTLLDAFLTRRQIENMVR